MATTDRSDPDLESAPRADPDALLKRLEEAEERIRRAKLKIFFGFAPGVGKTFAMLEAARRAKQAGADVVVGLIETHGRAETQSLLDGLEVLPRRKVAHRGVVLSEFDLEGALARKPALLLLDELAHTNAAGSRHAKRWQDVLELLDAGIDVHTTLNVQHVESLNDVVAQITTVRVRETVPDALLERADEIELIDLPEDELLARLREGKVYVPDQAAKALANFFRRGNLLALREIALRRTADLVDVDVRAYREEHGIGATWPAAERIAVGVGPSPASARLIRTARRMAQGLRAPWTAVWVETPHPLGLEDAARLESHLRLAESLGAEVVRLSGTNPADTILRHARRHNVTRIIVGKPTHSRLRDLVAGSLLERLVRGSGGIDVHVISGDVEEPTPQDDDEPARPSEWPDYLLAAEMVGVAALAAAVADQFLALPDIVMIFLVAIMFAALRVGRGPSVLAAALSVAAYDFLFVPPRYTFAVSDARHILTFAMMFAVGIFLSELTRRMKAQERQARQRETYTAALYAVARDLAGAGDADSVAGAMAGRAAYAFDGTVAVLLPGPDGALVEAARSGEATLDARDQSVARWAHEHGRSAGLGTDTLPGARVSCVPLRTNGHGLGVVAYVPRNPGRALEPEQRHLLEALARQGAVAFERVSLAKAAEAAELHARTEEMRSSMLSAVSHDLRTPLAAIGGAASALRDGAPGLDAARREELVETIASESARLERLVANLLDMIRLEAGAFEFRRDWVPLDEMVGSALNRLDAVLEGRAVATDLPRDLPLLYVDPVLFEQVLVNLLENGARHTPPGTPIAVSARADDSRVTIEIADRGPGVPERLLERIFEKFQRGPGASAGGVGLGLAICRGIVDAHGGKIHAGNRDGGGAVFTVSLPRADAPPAERTP
jgi:two-component system sensor histidine kinase KdpD